MVRIQHQRMGRVEVERVLELLLSFNRVNGAQLLYHTGIQASAFLQLRCNDETLALKLRHLRFHVALAVHGKSLSGQLAGVVSKHSGDGVPESGLAVGTAAIGDDHVFRINLAHCCHTYDFLNVVDQLLVVAEEGVQSILPELASFIARATCGDLGNQVVRVVRMDAIQSLRQIKGSVRCVQKLRIKVQLRYIDGEHRLCRILGIDDVLVVAVLHDKLLIGICTNQCKQKTELICWNQIGQLLVSALDRFLIDAKGNECILCLLYSIFRIGKLGIQEVLNGSQRLLLILIPAVTVEGDEVCGTGVSQAHSAATCYDLGLANIGIILRLQIPGGKLIVVLIRCDIAFLGSNLLIELDCAVPDGIKLLFR